MKLYDVIIILEKGFPPEDAYEWDNCGLLLGNKNKEIKKIFLTLDVTPKTAKEAVLCGADLVLSHHPVLFGGTKRITDETSDGEAITILLENKIALYAAHTSCDVAKNGINAELAKMFALSDIEKLEENGLGRVGILENEMTLSQFAEKTKKLLNTPFVRIVGDENKTIRKVAIGSGACSDSIPFAIEKGADLMLTADTKYHDMLNFSHKGIAIVDAGHFPTEIIVIDIFEKLLKPYGFETVKTKSTDIYKIM